MRCKFATLRTYWAGQWHHLTSSWLHGNEHVGNRRKRWQSCKRISAGDSLLLRCGCERWWLACCAWIDGGECRIDLRLGIAHQALQFALNKVSHLARTSAGEMHAISRTQTL